MNVIERLAKSLHKMYNILKHFTKTVFGNWLLELKKHRFLQETALKIPMQKYKII